MRKRVLIAVVLVVLAGGAFVVVRLGPSNLIGMLRYDQREEGSLRIGDPAPDVLLLSPDGKTMVRLASRFGGRPHVVVLGSFT
jgi:hypothetical protein